MKRPSLERLSESTVLYWLDSPEQIYISIKKIKETLKTLRCRLRHETEIVNNSRNLRDVTIRVERVERIKEKIEEETKALVSWRYIKWRYEKAKLEKVVFT